MSVTQYLRKEALILMHYEGQQFICTELFLFVVKQGKPTYDELEELGLEIGKKWKKLGRRLGVSDANLEEIDELHDQMSEKGYHMFKLWSEKNGSDATYQVLCDGFLNELVQRRDLAEKFCYINGNYFPLLQTYIHTYTCYIHIYTYMLHTHIHTCMHACMHTYLI